MKIGIIAHLKHPIRAPFAGGLEVFTHEITSQLRERGHEVLLFASQSSDSKLPLVSILSDQHYNQKSGVREKKKDIASEYIAEHHAYFSLMTTIDQYGLDIIFNNSLHYVPITMANTISTPMLTVLHTPPFYELQLAIAAERRHPTIQYVTISQKSADSWKMYVDDCSIIENGIVTSYWNDRHLIDNPLPYSCWFGRIHPDKGLHLAIEAAQEAGIHLKVAGGIADQRYYKEKIVPLLNDQVTMMGLLERDALRDLIGGASTCLVTPTWEEPFGLVVAEAMCCGTPIVGFKIGALPELINPEVGVLVNFADTDALAAAIQSAMILDRRKVRNYAMERFDINRMVSAYENKLHEVAQLSQSLNTADI